MEQFGWEAPKVNAHYPTERIQVTGRTYYRLLEELSMPEKELVGKTIISVGNGLSELVPAINTIEGKTEQKPKPSELIHFMPISEKTTTNLLIT